jgi:energy-coupling factor transporter ATP-binding protein EcfA2
VNCSRCNRPCTIQDHLTCWDSHITGNKERRTTHVGRPAESQLRVNEILQSETNIEKQRKLHQQDKKARWFIAGATREDGSYGMLYVTDRFEYLTSRGNMRSPSSMQQFPSLVSFIGETGAGKSTLIRALIKMSLKERSQHVETPVTRIAHADMLANPTSSGVHLYRDPATTASRRPILFADCEGFNAGAGVPTSRSGWTQEDDNRVIRKIPITSRLYAGDTKSSAVEELYSRFLYAFSDVVCFVTKSEQTITFDFQKLLEWASRGLQTSVNQTQKRTLIIILNARTEHDPALMEEDTAESRMFNSVGNVWENSPALKRIKDRTNRSDTPLNNHIYNTRDFLHKYFPIIKVCYVPLQVNTRLGEVGSQYELLRKQVVQGSNWASDARERTWMHYNIQDLSRLYGLAFEHYATSQLPLDFYRAARKDNPDPQSMTDHIANLLRHMENTEDERLVQCFPRVVASTLLNDALRGGGLSELLQHVASL